MTRFILRAVAVATLATGTAVASDPCPTGCDKCQHSGFRREKEPQPTCDTRIYPKSEACYIRQFCGPQLSPNACFGYFPTQWRTWDAACGIPVPAAPAAAAPAPTGDKKEPAPTPAVPANPAPDKKDKQDHSPVSLPGSLLGGVDGLPSTRLK
jgi:hypothetical protein